MTEPKMPPVQTAYDMKLIVVMSGCQAMEQMVLVGDERAALILKSFIEEIPCVGEPEL